MSKPIFFNTLQYAKILETGGIEPEQAKVHTEALCHAFAENLYSQDEVDKMIEAALKRFDDRTVQLREEMRKDREEIRGEMHKEFNKIHNEIRSVQDNILKRGYTALAVILAVIALSSNLIHFTH